ncbi:YqaJ viral recombinase family protein [Actinoallomurus sp. CA-142502]|uniref:YqaJ viral recombinase family nuclease n=1 Tax=Actinoallomurus sp. CA-142502 TaxID=3239885 RepID=UPI003D8B6C54
MTAELVLPYDAPRDVWLKARREGMGGSDALAALGLDPWKTRLEVYLDKIGEAPEREPTDRMRWGQIVEAAILEWFTDRTGIPVRRKGLMRSIEHPHQQASVDAESDDGGIVEIKNTNYHRRGEWEDDQVADGAEAQSQHYLGVTGRTHAWVVAQIGGEPPVIRRVERDDALIADIRAMELDLWRMVEARTPPPLEGGKAAEALVKRLFPTGVPGKRIDVDAEFMAKLREYGDEHAKYSAAEMRKKAIRAELAHVMGDATEAYYGDRLVATRRNQTKEKADFAALRARYPEAAADVITETHFRVFNSKLKES